jgi:hypothetical protein
VSPAPHLATPLLLLWCTADWLSRLPLLLLNQITNGPAVCPRATRSACPHLPAQSCLLGPCVSLAPPFVSLVTLCASVCLEVRWCLSM